MSEEISVIRELVRQLVYADKHLVEALWEMPKGSPQKKIVEAHRTLDAMLRGVKMTVEESHASND